MDNIGKFIGSLFFWKECLVRSLIFYSIITSSILVWNWMAPEKIHFLNIKQMKFLTDVLLTGTFFNFIIDLLVRELSKSLSKYVWKK